MVIQPPVEVNPVVDTSPTQANRLWSDAAQQGAADAEVPSRFRYRKAAVLQRQLRGGFLIIGHGVRILAPIRAMVIDKPWRSGAGLSATWLIERLSGCWWFRNFGAYHKWLVNLTHPRHVKLEPAEAKRVVGHQSRL